MIDQEEYICNAFPSAFINIYYHPVIYATITFI